MKSTAAGVAILIVICLQVFIFAGCSEEDCPVCPLCLVCEPCTLITTLGIEPAVDGYIIDGWEGHMKDGVGDTSFPYSKLIVMNNTSSWGIYNTEYRSIMEFDLSPVTGEVLEATLELVVDGRMNLPLHLMVVSHSYAGDGVFEIHDFIMGTPVDTLEYYQEWVVTFDVTDAVRSLIAAGETWAGFNIRVDPPTNIHSDPPGLVFRCLEARPPAVIRVTQMNVIDYYNASKPE